MGISFKGTGGVDAAFAFVLLLERALAGRRMVSREHHGMFAAGYIHVQRVVIS